VETASAACERDFVAVSFDIHRSGGKAAADVGEQAAGDQDCSLVCDVGGYLKPSGGLIVKTGKAYRATLGLEEQAGQYGYGRPRRQRPGCPGDGFCQDVPFDSELHGRVPPFIAAAMSELKTRSRSFKSSCPRTPEPAWSTLAEPQRNPRMGALLTA